MVAGKEVLQRGIEKVQQEIEEVNKLIGECKISISNAQKTKEDITKNKECPTCLQPISEEHKHNIEQKESKIISDKEIILKEATEKQSEASKQLEESRKTLEQVREKESELQALKVKLELYASLEKEINDKNKALGDLANEITVNSEQLEQSNKLQVEKKKIEIKEKKEFVRKVREIEKLRKEKDNLNNMLNDKLKTKQQVELEQDTIKKDVGDINRKKVELNLGLKRFIGIEDRLKKTKKDYETLSKQEKDAEIAMVAAEKEKQGVEKITEVLEREIALKKGIKEKLNNLSKTQNWLEDFFINLIEVMEKHIMAQLYNEFNELFQNWFRVLIEDENISVRLDDTFTPVIEQNGYETFLENLSGGEKTSCALAYRLALNKVINGFVGNINTNDIIILDEPTDGFSTEQLDSIRDVLDQINIKQVIVVSHESKIESFVDNVIRIAKNEHISSVV